MVFDDSRKLKKGIMSVFDHFEKLLNLPPFWWLWMEGKLCNIVSARTEQIVVAVHLLRIA